MTRIPVPPRRRAALLTALALLLLGSGIVQAGYDWEPLTDADWSVGPDSTRGIRDAVVIFEKVTFDDTELMRDRVYIHSYTRVRVLSAAGRELGDIIHQYDSKDFYDVDVRGRTVLRDGSIIPLANENIFEERLLETDDEQYEQQAFSMPGLTDDCVFEFIIKRKMDRPYQIWTPGTTVPLLYGEYVWRVFSGEGLSSSSFKNLARSTAPNYLWRNLDQQVDYEQRPAKGTVELVFRIRDVPAFELEPYALPEDALRPQFHHYYGDKDYWAGEAEDRWQQVKEFTDRDKRLRRVVEEFEEFESADARLRAAYDWLIDNIDNVGVRDHWTDPDYEHADSADEVAKRGYGSQREINYAFLAMLRRLGIDARIGYVVDRDENLFVADVNYWQFDRSVVAVSRGDGGYVFCSPGDRMVPIGQVPWYVEGVQAFLVGPEDFDFESVPFSTARANRAQRVHRMELLEDRSLRCRLTERRTGHLARRLRLRLRRVEVDEHAARVREVLEEYWPESGTRVSAVTVEKIDDLGQPVSVNCEVELEQAGQEVGGRLVIRPFEFLAENFENPFQDDVRRTPIVFHYPYESTESLTLAIPSGWTIEATPDDQSHSSPVGVCEARFMAIGGTLTVQHLFRLNSAFWPAADYAMVRELYESLAALTNLSVVLKQVPADGGAGK